MSEHRMQNTRESILIAARDVFMKKGYAGARMQEIANEAGINKALLHYYFKNKETLFEMILFEALKTIQAGILVVLESEMDLFEKIRFFCNRYIGFLQSNTYLVSFILHEINQDPEKLVQYFTRAGLKAPKQLMIQMEMEAQKGNIRKVDPLQMILNILSLCVFPFVARPIVKGVFRIQDKEYNDLIEIRKKEIPEWIISSLKKG